MERALGCILQSQTDFFVNQLSQNSSGSGGGCIGIFILSSQLLRLDPAWVFPDGWPR